MMIQFGDKYSDLEDMLEEFDSCSDKFGHISIHPKHEEVNGHVEISYDKSFVFLLVPKIITSDENIRNFSPKEWVVVS